MSTVDPPKSTAAVPLNNSEIATTLDTVAGLLEAQGANPFRVQAYRRGANRARTAAADRRHPARRR
ncbi:MAG: helix-hairpin-helix domain-containing protein [Caldilineaceae bacterium]